MSLHRVAPRRALYILACSKLSRSHWQLAAIGGVGPRVEESGLGLIAGYPFSAPYEDVKLKGK